MLPTETDWLIGSIGLFWQLILTLTSQNQLIQTNAIQEINQKDEPVQYHGRVN